MLREEVNSTNRGCDEPPSPQSPPFADPLPDLLKARREFLSFIRRRVPSAELAEDILQTAYLRAVQHSGSLHSGESSTAWFYRILRNAVIDFYRRRTVEDRALDAWAAELVTTVQPDVLTRDIVCQCIAQVLPSLKASYAQALAEIDLAEGTLATYAAQHGITLANATVRIHRARKALKQRLLETCGACALHACLDCNCVA